jgi:hypothetical protein
MSEAKACIYTISFSFFWQLQFGKAKRIGGRLRDFIFGIDFEKLIDGAHLVLDKRPSAWKQRGEMRGRDRKLLRAWPAGLRRSTAETTGKPPAN